MVPRPSHLPPVGFGQFAHQHQAQTRAPPGGALAQRKQGGHALRGHTHTRIANLKLLLSPGLRVANNHPATRLRKLQRVLEQVSDNDDQVIFVGLKADTGWNLVGEGDLFGGCRYLLGQYLVLNQLVHI